MTSADCKAWEDSNLSLSTTNNQSAKLFHDVLTQYVTWTEFEHSGGIEGTLKLLSEEEPDFVMGKALSIGLDLMGTGRTIRLDDEFGAEIKNLESLMIAKDLSVRERKHCKAVVLVAHDQMEAACDIWEDILIEHPNDIMAIKFAHDSYFYLGDSPMIRDSVGRVLPYWSSKDPYYGYLNGMYAFGLEEMNMYDLAEKYATNALALNRSDCWATHAKAHCYEMTGRTNEGIEFMSGTEKDWSKCAMLACHNYWHWALYHIEKGEYEVALGIYDQQVGERSNSGAMLDIVDAASLLKRFEFQGVSVADRWKSLYELCRPHLDDHITVFNDVHFLMCLLGVRKTDDVVETFMGSLDLYIKETKGTNQRISERVGQKLCQAIIAYSEGRYDDVVSLMLPIKNEISTIGGSHAQRDVFNQLLLYACILSKTEKNFKLGKSLLHERKLLKESSPLTDRMMNKWLSCHT